ncbi:MAG: pyruvate dehydrogenase subunit beta [Gemmatales bacterium]|nr:MAG: pyruvate dehydrogenase subunit beta [Gemmatales bacterium]
MRKLNYGKAINEALGQAMELCPDVIVLGQLVDYKSGIFGTTTGLVDRFGPKRVQDFPVSESVMTATALGASLVGLRPVLVHQRMDFMLYSVDAIANWLALWRFKSNGQSSVPVTIRVIVGRGWGQGPQHSKSLHAWFAHLPGLKVAIPATAYDVKGLLLESIFGEDPAMIIENRSLFSMNDHVPENAYRVRYGQATIRRKGKDLTLVAIGVMVPMALRVAEQLAKEGIDIEVIDPRTLTPFDETTICCSVAKTKRLAVADPGWYTGSFAGEIISRTCEHLGTQMKAAPLRVCLPDSHTPMSSALEARYYPSDEDVANRIRVMFGRQPACSAA